MSQTISISSIGIKTVEKQYSDAESIIEEIISKLSNAREILDTNYLGLASEINSESLTRYIEHLEFLKLCCEATREYSRLSCTQFYSYDLNQSRIYNKFSFG